LAATALGCDICVGAAAPSHCAGGIQGIPFLGDIPFTFWTDKGTLLFTMLLAMGFAEFRRLQVRVTGWWWGGGLEGLARCR
jgi:hypothetical protein